MYEFSVNIIDEDGIDGWMDCDEDDGMEFLPIFGDKIIIKCCFKS